MKNNSSKEKNIVSSEEKQSLTMEDQTEEMIEFFPDIKGSNIPEPKKKEIISHYRKLTVMSHHKGPIPAPDDVKQYNEIIPNGAERIMAMAEEQGRHRRSQEKKELDLRDRSESRGGVYGFTISLIVLGLACLLIIKGETLTGLSAVLFLLSSLVGVFIYGKNKTVEKK